MNKALLVVMTIMIFSSPVFAKDTDYRMPNIQEAKHIYQTRAMSAMMKALTLTYNSARLDCPCVEVVISSNTKGDVELRIDESKCLEEKPKEEN